MKPKFIKFETGHASASYFNAHQIMSISEISSDLTDYKPRLSIILTGELNGGDCHLWVDTSFDEFLKWLKSDNEVLSVPKYPEKDDELE